MEEKLQGLMRAGNRENRVRWARDWQAQGRKVIAVIGGLVPEEVIYAAGMLPWRVRGAWQEDVSAAMMYRLPQGCDFLNHVMESVLKGELDFLDGIVSSNRDEDFLRFGDYLGYLGKVPLIYLIDVPIKDSGMARQRFTRKIQDFAGVLADFGKVTITDSSLSNAIDVYNKGYALLRKIYEMRKRQVPPLSGGEALALASAAMVMPRDIFNQQLEELLPYLEKRKAKIPHIRPRVLLSSDHLDNPAYIDLVEETGCLVAMDDLDTGSRYFWEKVKEDSDGPARALARRYLMNRAPRMLDWEAQSEQLLRWTRAYKIDGVLELPDIYDYPRGFRRPYLEQKLKEAGVPFMSFNRDYHLSNIGQLRTRIGAFLEMLGNKR